MHKNSGSATLTAVIAILFIIALGSALLYTTYIGYSVSIADRGNKENFYNADAEMKKIITGVQDSLSNSLVPAYTATLSHYANGEISDPQIDFSKATIAGIKISAGGTSTALLSNGGSNYSVLALASILGTPKSMGDGSFSVQVYDDTVKLSGSGTVVNAIDKTGMGNLTLKDVKMEYKSVKGYITEISTDIQINIPVFFSVSIASDTNGYAIIAEKGLTYVSGGDKGKVDGNVYAGSNPDDKKNNAITISGNVNDTLNKHNVTFCNGNVCAQGEIVVNNGVELIYSAPNKELWANKITLGDKTVSGSAKLEGKIYVADDLLLSGANSSATLIGEYFGFGSGSTPSTSSAILVNGLNSTLNISGLKRLSLAGVGYVDTGSASSQIIMGESIATKADQLAYLLPQECLSHYKTNPCVLDVDSFSKPIPLKAEDWNNSAVLWTINGVSKTLQYYLDLGPSGGKGEILPLYPQGSNIAYVFIVFKTRSAANEYFRDYFTVYPQRIEQYSDLYLKTLSANAANVNSAGNTFYNGAGDKLTLYPSDSTILTGDLSTRYKSKTSPFDRYVFRDMLTENLDFGKDGKIVAVIRNGDYTYDSSESNDLKLIVAKGNVTVQKSFTGMIIAGGNVTIEGINTTITAATLNTDILNATSGGKSLSEYVHGLSAEGSDNAWDMNKLVVYSEWKKN